MPQMNGLEMITAIREEDKNIPIIFVTAIDDSDVIIEALRLQVSNFLKKPIDVDSLLEVMDRTVKLIIANKTIEKENKEKLRMLQERDEYFSYQEELGFLKELNILRNDFYYQKIGPKNQCLVDFIYMPLDTLSGDAYSAREVGRNRYFYFLVDGMGKGISAAFTSILMTAFCNYKIDKIFTSHHDFSLEYLVQEVCHYIQPILLDFEMVALSFVELDAESKTMHYAHFAMPPILLEDRAGTIHKLKSNNAPLSSFIKDFYVDSYDISNIVKYLIYSDGINENSIYSESDMYGSYLEEDFKHSFTREDFKNRYLEKIDTPEDDTTAIFLHHINLDDALLCSKEIQSNMLEVEKTQEWYENYIKDFVDDERVQSNATLTFTEMLLNAHEHGNLGIDYEQKHKMIEDGSYWDYLETQETTVDKNIMINLYKVKYHDNQSYLLTNIIDEGEGFNTQILSTILRNRDGFNGKGVYISHKLSAGIYYNKKGNDVTFIHKLS